MNTAADLTDALGSLKANPEAIPWPGRRNIVARVASPLTEGLAGEPFRSLLLLLARDPKWEVRRDVAEVLGTVPDNELALVAETLLEDTHGYVRRAAKESIRRRRKRFRDTQKRKRGLDLILALDQEIEEAHGRAAAEKARRMAEHLYDVLVGATVHEMRAVLTTLKESNARVLELLEASPKLDPRIKGKCTTMADRILFLERLFLDMRDYTRPVPEERTPVPLADLIGEARSIVSENLRARGVQTRRVHLDVSLPPAVELRVSRYHIVAALVNVLKNAFEALPGGDHGQVGRVSVLVRRQDRSVHLAVRDSGIGIPAADLYEVRQCLPGRTSKRGYGTGFGLCCARRNVEAHGGHLQIESRPGHGTTVTLALPYG